MKLTSSHLLLTALVVSLLPAAAPGATPALPIYHEIQIVDADTGRGVPLVQLETTNHIDYVTDSAGRVAFYEPGLMDSSVFFTITSPGYKFASDGFGYEGVVVDTTVGKSTILKMKRKNIAERLYRTTGEGIYRDSVMLDKKVPLSKPLLNAKVVGQDSVQRAIYKNKIYWFWGDTSQASYPLGNFRTTGGTSELPANGGLAPADGVDISYFKDENGFTKQMCPFTPSDGVIWIEGLLVVPDANGRERMIMHYSRRADLVTVLDHGLGVWNDRTQQFDPYLTLPLSNTWQFPRGNAMKATEGGDYYYFSNTFPTTRVKADAASLADPSAYEAWSCVTDGSSADPKTATILRDGDGKLVYRWTKLAPPIGPDEQAAFRDAGLITGAECTFFPRDVDKGKIVQMHGGTVDWNPWRQRWIMIATQQYAKSSQLGEIWYAEAKDITGPWTTTVKLITHNDYDFYNPVDHPFFSQAGGRIIYFEGTYTNTFEGSPIFTPRYDYNNVMYRFDLSDPRIQAAWVN